MLSRRLSLFLLPLSIVLFAACNGEDDDAPTATATVPATSAGSATATSPATAAPTTAAPSATAVDGTVAPQNPGAKDPVTTKSRPDPLTGTPVLKDVRMGVHPENGGWERIVFEFEGGLPGAEVRYVPSISGCGSGMAVSLQGTAVLSVRFEGAAQHNEAGQSTFAPQTIDGPGNTILEAKQWCDFEAVLGWAMGVKADQNFKVTTLDSPPRLVIDVKQ
jgi:hypothetical protein